MRRSRHTVRALRALHFVADSVEMSASIRTRRAASRHVAFRSLQSQALELPLEIDMWRREGLQEQTFTLSVVRFARVGTMSHARGERAD